MSPTIAKLQAVFTCDECGYMQFAEAYRQLQPHHSWETNVVSWFSDQNGDALTWWPAVGVSKEFDDVPPHIADAASEAHRCYSIQAYRALYSKLEELEKQGHVRAHIKEAAHEVRHLGNDVAHGDFVDPVTAEEAEETLALMAEVLQEVFQSPARIEKAKQKRLARRARDAAD